jgi:Tfp pilus assembly protein PilX
MCGFGISRQPRGAALVIVMLVMAVLLMAGTAFLTISSTESQIALNEQGYATAYALAEAGIHKAIASLNDPIRGPAYLAIKGETNTALGGGTFSVSVVTPSKRLQSVDRCPTDNSKDITAKASVPVRGGNAVVTLVVTVDQVAYPYNWAAFARVPNQIISSLYDPLAGSSVDRTNSEFWLGSHALVDSFDSGVGSYNSMTNSGLHGNVGANGDVEIDHNSMIDGNVQAGDDLIKSSGVTVTGTQTSGLSPNSTDAGVSFPTVTPPVAPTGPLIWTDTSNPKELAPGTYYFTYIQMAPGTRLSFPKGGPVTIYVTGPPITSTNKLADLGSNVTMGAPGTQLQIVTKSDPSTTDYLTFVAQDNFSLYGSLYGKNTDVYLGNNSQVYGSIIGRTVRVDSRSYSPSKIHYDQAMLNQKLCHTDSSFHPTFTIRRGTWQEVIPST